MVKFYFLGKGNIYQKHKEAIEFLACQEVKDWKEADWVVVLTPNYLHFKQALRFAKKGKKVLVEKPLCFREKEVEILEKYPVYCVFQLRYLDLDVEPADYYDIWAELSFKRKKSYFEGWKGQEKKTGGLLFHLGIHYLDYVFGRFGWPRKWEVKSLGPKEAEIEFFGRKYRFYFHLKSGGKRNIRIISVNNRPYSWLAERNLFIDLYGDILDKKGIHASRVKKLINILENCALFKSC